MLSSEIDAPPNNEDLFPRDDTWITELGYFASVQEAGLGLLTGLQHHEPLTVDPANLHYQPTTSTTCYDEQGSNSGQYLSEITFTAGFTQDYLHPHTDEDGGM